MEILQDDGLRFSKMMMGFQKMEMQRIVGCDIALNGWMDYANSLDRSILDFLDITSTTVETTLSKSDADKFEPEGKQIP